MVAQHIRVSIKYLQLITLFYLPQQISFGLFKTLLEVHRLHGQMLGHFVWFHFVMQFTNRYLDYIELNGRLSDKQ
jgi:hypothetical protein